MRHWVVALAIVIAGCSKKKTEDKAAPAATAPAEGADPWKAGDKSGEAKKDKADDDGEMPSDDGGEAEPAAKMPSDDGGEALSATQRLCKRDQKCGCPIPDCDNFIAKTGLSDDIIECFVKQPCDSLCAKNSGAPGSALYKTCMAGKVPTGDSGGGGLNKPCQRTADCPGQHECCGGYCYEMGTSLWITACQMPTGKF